MSFFIQEPDHHQSGGYSCHLGHLHPGHLHGILILPRPHPQQESGVEERRAERQLPRTPRRADVRRRGLGKRASPCGSGRRRDPDAHLRWSGGRDQPVGQSAEKMEDAGSRTEKKHLRSPRDVKLDPSFYLSRKICCA